MGRSGGKDGGFPRAKVETGRPRIKTWQRLDRVTAGKSEFSSSGSRQVGLTKSSMRDHGLLSSGVGRLRAAVAQPTGCVCGVYITVQPGPGMDPPFLFVTTKNL